MTVDFKDFDAREAYEPLSKRARSASARNFVLDFSHARARCAFDIDESDLQSISSVERPAEYITRWINIWGPHRQTKIVDHLAATYGFTPRLRGLMREKPVHNLGARKQQQRYAAKHKSGATATSTQGSQSSDEFELNNLDLEKHPAQSQTTEGDLVRDLNHYDVVSSIYHYSSVDLGVKYFCIGYNMMHNVRPDRHDEDDQLGYGASKLPRGDRIWTWLILCDDHTVISMFEDPYSTGMRSPKLDDASELRHNLLNVFEQLSKVNSSVNRNPISLVPLRHTETAIGDFPERVSQLDDRQAADIDGPGLLFYYLFDDWWNTYAMLTQQDHQYGAELNQLRDEMIKSPRVGHVYSLQHIGRQLACLKRLYESYELVIVRILDKQRMPVALSLPSQPPSAATAQPDPTALSNASPYPTSAAPHSNEALYSRPICVPVSAYPPNAGYPVYSSSSSSSTHPHAYDQYGVYLTSAARVRFERLKDRVRLYAITEIQESIDLKDSLVTMNYNLIAVKEAGSMERLTRVTTLLSKATILFLPISLLSAYFSIQWEEPQGETVTAYWIAFAVILFVTFCLLVVFGTVSKTLEGKVLYQPIWRAGVQVAQEAKGGILGRRRERRRGGEKESDD